MLEKTVVGHAIGQHVTGYMLNTLPSRENCMKIAELQTRLKAEFGEVIWNTPPETLHVTLMDWIAPLVDYGADKDHLYEQLFPEYDEEFSAILKAYGPIEVHFDTVRATPGAIIVVGEDRGEFQAIRNEFLRRIELLPGTKQPPTIIHSTIARFTKEQDLQPIADFIAENQVAFDQTVASFRLVREIIAPQLEHALLKEYSLAPVSALSN